MYVKSLVPHGSAMRSGIVCEGDEIVSITEGGVCTSLEGASITKVRDHIIGTPGTAVMLVFRRPIEIQMQHISQGRPLMPHSKYHVLLERGDASDRNASRVGDGASRSAFISNAPALGGSYDAALSQIRCPGCEDRARLQATVLKYERTIRLQGDELR